jgi:hypothetical protein
MNNKVVKWLLSGDVSIQYQVHRDLLETKRYDLKKIQNQILSRGWGIRFLKERHSNGHWGKGYYQPKWTSTHYTLLDLKNIGFPPNNKEVVKSVNLALKIPDGIYGGINVAKSLDYSDVCLNGMILNIASYFTPQSNRLKSLVDFLLNTQMKDGGWNCEYLKEATHSSLHTTISVLEGLLEFRYAGNHYQLESIQTAEKNGIEFLLEHKLYKSHRTGNPIKPEFTRLSYPSRWRYDILRALDYFQYARIKYDKRINDALNVLLYKKNDNGKWLLQAHHKGQVHFDMEKVGVPSRWNTLRALRVLKFYSDSM